MAGHAKASSSSSNYYNTAAESSTTYDVFLNFRGEDTRRNFTGHLHRALTRERIRVFLDSYELWEGEDIGSKLLDSIQGSKISIPVFSKGYAASKWCLKELVKILECHTSNNQIVLPIFFDVDPSDVRHQNGSFEEAFLEHEKNFDLHIVQLWRDALTKIGSMKGWVLGEIENGNEAKLVELVVERALSEAINIPFTDVKYRIGLDSRVNDLQSLLNINFGDVQYIGICGIGGIGKTTVAKALYYSIIRSFRQGCFLPNIREEALRDNGLVSLQEKLILSVSKRKVHGEILSVENGKRMIKGRLHGENVLLILDDVDHRSQLDAFALDLNWLGRGSTVIITTRDESILNMANIAKDRVYWPTQLDDDQSLQFFSLCAFQKIKPFEDYVELSRAVASYSGGLPLTLEVLGSYLSGVRNKEEWESTIEQLKLCAPNDEVFERLRISYDNLENDYQKAIFLDSACFFVGWDRETVISIWEACGFYPRLAITRLIQRSLLNFEYDEDGGCYLRMHDQIQCMGKEIVLKESFREPGNRSRLWSHDEIREVLEGNRGTNKIEGIVLPTGIPITLASEHFERMSNLRLLNINSKSFIGDFWRLSYALRWFRWNTCSWDFLPNNFYHKRLTNLNLSFSMIKQTWVSNPEEENKFQNLKVLNLSNCGDLQIFPSFLWFPCLEKLDLGYCRNLYMLDKSMGRLIQLKSLNLESCDSLKELPTTIGNLKSLVELKLRNVSKIVELPDGVGLLDKLEELDALGCRALVRLPVMSRLRSLRRLYINNCHSLQQIQFIETPKFFEILDATNCSQLTLPRRKILGQGSLLIGRLDEFSYSLTANDGMSHKELVLCIVFEFKPNLFDGQKLIRSPEVICFEISATVRENEMTARFHHTLKIEGIRRSEEDIIYVHYFKGFDWFGIPLHGKDAIENLIIRGSDSYLSKLRLKFWKLLFRKPEQQKPNVAEFFSWLGGEPDLLNWPELEYGEICTGVEDEEIPRPAKMQRQAYDADGKSS